MFAFYGSIFNENSTMSPLRRKLRDEDDLAQVQEPPAKKISKPTSRNDIVSHDNTRSLIQKKIEVYSKVLIGIVIKEISRIVNKLDIYKTGHEATHNDTNHFYIIFMELVY